MYHKNVRTNIVLVFQWMYHTKTKSLHKTHLLQIARGQGVEVMPKVFTSGDVKFCIIFYVGCPKQIRARQMFISFRAYLDRE